MIQEKKQECDEDYLPTELRQVAVGFRLEMLELAYMCYKSASQCVDEESEEWLTDYMMGKCLEKMHKAPKEYLNFYRQVSCYFQFLITLYKLNTDISEGEVSAAVPLIISKHVHQNFSLGLVKIEFKRLDYTQIIYM